MRRTEHPDAVVNRLAQLQQGVAARYQLLGDGLSARMIEYRLDSGRFGGLFHGVYQVVPLPGPWYREIGALLASGSQALLSHASAGAVWEHGPKPDVAADIDVLLPHGVRRRVAGIRAHRCRDLLPEDVAEYDGLRLTSPARTLLDLAGMMGDAELERAVARAVRSGQVTIAGLLGHAARHARHRGASRLQALLSGGTAPAFVRSDAEAQALALFRSARLPRPAVNMPLLGYEVDFLWAAERVIVEVDGRAYHGSARAFTLDRRRDAALAAAGYRVVRITWDDITRHPTATAVIIAQVLARS